MEKINLTYLLGTGASCSTLPLAHNMLESMRSFSKELDNFVTETTHVTEPAKQIDNFSINRAELIQNLKDDILWLCDEGSLHDTVDTFAKKLFVTEKEYDLKRLKSVLSCFLMYEQAFNGFDKRYDSFIASLVELKNYVIMPSNINILTWNYDYQFEMAAHQYFNEMEYRYFLDRIQSIPRNQKDEFDETKFSIVRLNGIAGYNGFNQQEYRFTGRQFEKHREVHGLSINYNSLNNNIITDEILLHYYYSKEGYSFINFAWEHNDKIHQIQEIVSTITQNTQIFVIIGYSYPFFNRNIDSMIINNICTNNSRGNTMIYVQDIKPDPSIQRLKSLFEESYGNVMIEPINNTDYFFIPHNFN